MPKYQQHHNDNKRKSHKTSNNNNNKITKHNHRGSDPKPLKIKTKSIKSVEFDDELMRLKEREAGAAGRNKIKKSLATNIVIKSPTLQMANKGRSSSSSGGSSSSSYVDLLLMNEEADMMLQSKAMANTFNSNSNRNNKNNSNNMYSVLDDDDDAKPRIVIQPSIFKVGLPLISSNSNDGGDSDYSDI